MKSVGIDIGSHSIKIAEVVQTNKGVIVTSIREHVLGQNPAYDSQIEILEFLRNLAPQYLASEWRITFALRQEKVSVRNKIFPFADRLKILKSLPFELEEELPFSPDTAIYDAKIVKTMGQSAEVLACASPKIKVAEIVEKMGDVGFDMSVLSAEAIALANCIENWSAPIPHEQETSLQLEGESRPPRTIEALVHIGHQRTLVCAFDGRSLIGVRSIFWGAQSVAEKIAQKYEMTFLQAMKEIKKSFILLNQKDTSYDHVAFSDCIAGSIKELVQELRLTLLEFKSEFNGELAQVRLTGGGSQIQNLHAYLTTQLEVPVNNFSPLSEFQTVGIDRHSELNSICGVAVGLAIEGLRKPKNPALNLLKQEFQKQNKRLQNIWYSWGRMIQLGAAAFVVFMIYSTIREQLANSLDEVVSEKITVHAKAVAGLQPKKATESGVKKYIKEQRKRAQDIRHIENLAEMNSALDILRKVSDAAPSKGSLTLNVRRIAVLNQRLEIEGTVAKPQELSLLQQSLRQLSINNKVETLPARASAPGVTNFAFAIQVDRQIQSGGKTK